MEKGVGLNATRWSNLVIRFIQTRRTRQHLPFTKFSYALSMVLFVVCWYGSHNFCSKHFVHVTASCKGPIRILSLQPTQKLHMSTALSAAKRFSLLCMSRPLSACSYL